MMSKADKFFLACSVILLIMEIVINAALIGLDGVLGAATCFLLGVSIEAQAQRIRKDRK